MDTERALSFGGVAQAFDRCEVIAVEPENEMRALMPLGSTELSRRGPSRAGPRVA